MLFSVSITLAQFGIRGGINIGTFSGNDKTKIALMFLNPTSSLAYDSEPLSRTGFTGGIFSNFKLIGSLSVQQEILYTQKGAVYELSQTKIRGIFKLDYIDIPVLLKYTFSPLPIIKPFIEAGMSYSILVSANIKHENPIFPLPEEQDIKDFISKSDFSILIGIGTELAMIDINARYITGLTQIFKKNKLGSI